MRVLTLTLKDLSQIIRDRKSLIYFILMPVVFTAFMGFALTAGSTSDQTTAIQIGWLNLDGETPISAALRSSLESSQSYAIKEVAPAPQAELEQHVQENSMAATVVVPAGYSSALSSGAATPLQVILDQNSADAETVQSAVQASLASLLASQEIARLVAPSSGAQQSAAFQSAFQAWQNPGYAIVSQTPGPAKPQVLDNAYNQSSPGMMVMFAIFGLITSAMVLVNERQTNTLQRMFAGGVSMTEIIVGHTLAMFVVVFVQSSILIAFGQAVFHVNYLSRPAASLLALGALALWVSALGLLIGAISKDVEQVTMFGMLAMFVLSALGGAMFPLDFAGNAFTTVGKLLPSSWSMGSFQDVLVRGYSLGHILPGLAVQAGFAALFLFLAVSRFKKAGALA